MKNYILIILTALFFGACATTNVPQERIQSKQALINKANKGSIQAMLDLNKQYDFPNSKEGLYYFEKWYKDIDEKDNKDEIYALYKIFEKYKLNIADGLLKANRLFDLSRGKEGFKGFYDKLDSFLLKKESKKLNNIPVEKFQSLNEKEMNQIINLFDKYKTFPKKFNIVEMMKKKNYELPHGYYIYKMKYAKSAKEKQKAIDKQFKSVDKKELKNSIEYFIRKKDFKNAQKFLKNLKNLDSKDPEVYILYAKLENKKVRRSKEAIKYFKEAVKYGDFKAAGSIIFYYAEKKDFDAFLKFEEEFKDSVTVQKAIGNFYTLTSQNAKASEYFEKAAQQGDIDTIALLATTTKDIYKFYPKISKAKQKYQQYVLNSNNWELIDKVLDKSMGYYDQRRFKEFNEKLFEKLVKNGKFIQLRKYGSKYRSREKSLYYLNEAAKTGDVQSLKLLAKHYTEKRKNRNLSKTIEILDQLVLRGDTHATDLLAKIYYNPTYKFDEFKDHKKAIKYLELLAQKEIFEAYRKLVKIYIQNEKLKDYKRALFYQEKIALKTKSAKDYRGVGILYTFKENEDFSKAKEYLQKAIDLGDKKAYLYMALIYYKDKNLQNNIERVDYKKAFEYLKKAENYSSNSWYYLGMFYKYGYVVEKDIEKAKYLFEKSAQWGNKDALKELKELTESKE